MAYSTQSFRIGRLVFVKLRTYETLDSTLSEAKRLFERGELLCWDSILAAEQTAGRGQNGRSWVSERGNLFSAVRLPLVPPFSLPCAPLALSLVYCETLAEFGFDCRLKWPNDLVVKIGTGYGKCSGTLLERKGELLVAGTGINILSAPLPGQMREGAAIPAASLMQSNPQAARGLTPHSLWLAIMKRLTQTEPEAFSRSWHERAAQRLLWLGQPVRFIDARAVHEGTLAGLGSSGELILETRSGRNSFVSGALLPAGPHR
jgi:BirA family biotin operon repressor/biotin-[acetyl-CoA-carboxylase] ligase